MKTNLVLALILTLLLAACGNPAADTQVAQVQPAQSSEIVQSEALNLVGDVDVQTVADIKNRDDVLLIDVREQWEYDEGHIPGITLIPMGEVADRLAEIPTDKTVVVTCRSGNRSGKITNFLQQQGFDNVHNMQGGINAWAQAGYEVEN